jgi:hypothetical protein
MITPKEKAKELILKHLRVNHGFNVHIARQCALIAVNEVIEALHEHHWQNRLIIDYWEEVKQEIENYG